MKLRADFELGNLAEVEEEMAAYPWILLNRSKNFRKEFLSICSCMLVVFVC